MSHFSDEVWADLARGCLPAGQLSDVTRHLEAGCAQCAPVLRDWEAVSRILHRENDYEPPADVLERARRSFALAYQRDKSLGVESIARLVFDSFRSPAPVGLRSVERSNRQLCFETDQFYLDLRIEEHPGSSGASVLGQLMPVPTSGQVSVEALTVTLVHGGTPLASTTTNQLGEFQLEIESDTDDHVSVELGEPVAVVVPLGRRRRRVQ